MSVSWGLFQKQMEALFQHLQDKHWSTLELVNFGIFQIEITKRFQYIIIFADHINSLDSYVTNTFQHGNYLPGSDWSSRMYFETAAESFLACKAMCYYHQTNKCKLFAYNSGKCYLGDPSGTYTAVSSGEYSYIYGDYGNFFIVFICLMVLPIKEVSWKLSIFR